MQTQGWDPQGTYGILVTKSSAAKGSLIYLRPGDVFNIGNVTLELQLEASEKPGNPEVQVTSSGCDTMIVAENDKRHDVKIKPMQDCEITSQPISTPGLPHGIDNTIMETPEASRYHEPDLNHSPTRSVAVHDRQKYDEDTTERESHKFAVKLALIDEAKETIENCHTKDELATIIPRAKVDQDQILHPTAGSQVAEPSFHEDNITNANAEDTGKSLVDIKTPQTFLATESTSKSRKRKRTEDASKDGKTGMIYEKASSSASSKAVKQQKLMDNAIEVNKKNQTSPDVQEPASSNMSTRSGLREKSDLLPSSNEMRVFFASSTSVGTTSKSMGFLKKNGILNAKSVIDCDVLCIGKGDLKKTSNLILAVMSGKEVITEDWVTQSVAKGELLDHNDFLARDPSKEAEWGINLTDAIARGRQGIKPFLNFTLYFTPAAKKELGKGFAELKEIALHAGASDVHANPLRKSDLRAPNALIIAALDDRDLSGLKKGGWKAFRRDIVTLSALRGALDTGSAEFLICGDIGDEGEVEGGNKVGNKGGDKGRALGKREKR